MLLSLGPGVEALAMLDRCSAAAASACLQGGGTDGAPKQQRRVAKTVKGARRSAPVQARCVALDFSAAATTEFAPRALTRCARFATVYRLAPDVVVALWSLCLLHLPTPLARKLLRPGEKLRRTYRRLEELKKPVKQVKSATTLRKRATFTVGQSGAAGAKRGVPNALPPIVAAVCAPRGSEQHPGIPAWATHALGSGESLARLEAAAKDFASIAALHASAVPSNAAASAADALVDVELDLARAEAAAQLARAGMLAPAPVRAPRTAVAPSADGAAMPCGSLGQALAQQVPHGRSQPPDASAGGFLSDSEWDDDAADALCAQALLSVREAAPAVAASGANAAPLAVHADGDGGGGSAECGPFAVAIASNMPWPSSSPDYRGHLPIHVHVSPRTDATDGDVACAIAFDDAPRQAPKPAWQTLPALQQYAIAREADTLAAQGSEAPRAACASPLEPSKEPCHHATRMQELTDHDLAAIIGADSSALCDIVFGDGATDPEPAAVPHVPFPGQPLSNTTASPRQSVAATPGVTTDMYTLGGGDTVAPWQEVELCFDDGPGDADAQCDTPLDRQPSAGELAQAPPSPVARRLSPTASHTSPAEAGRPVSAADVSSKATRAAAEIPQRRGRPVIRPTILKVCYSCAVVCSRHVQQRINAQEWSLQMVERSAALRVCCC